MASFTDHTICAICAIIIVLREQDDDSEDDEIKYDPSFDHRVAWRGSAIALQGPFTRCYTPTSEAMNVSDEDILLRIAIPDGTDGTLHIMPDGPDVMPQLCYHADVDEPSGLHCCFGLHSACLEMAQRVMKSSRNASIRRMRDLWVTLERRCAKTFKDECLIGSFVPNIPENRRGEPVRLSLGRYYVPENHIGGEEDEEGEREWWYYSPLNIPGLTTSLIANLIRYYPPRNTSDFAKRFQDLPQEIKDKVTELIPGELLALSCNYLMPQSQWKDILLQIPFFWDIDEETIDIKMAEADTAGFTWDWEKLTRQLMTPPEMPTCSKTEINAWGYDKIGLDVPFGLTNRRRIRQILEEMYPNDVGLK